MKNYHELSEKLSLIPLTESLVTAKQLEKVLVVGYNILFHGEKGRDEALNSTYESVKGVCDSYSKLIHTFASRGDLLWHSGGSQGTLSRSWIGTDATYKTDMYLSSARNSSKVKISFKMVGSQVVSAERNEALSILNAVNSFYFKNNPDPRLGSLIEGVKEGFGSILTRMTAKELAMLATNPVNLVGEVLRYLELKEIHEVIAEKFSDYFSSSPDFRKWFVYEALSGNVKFGGGLGSANHLLMGDMSGPTSMEKLTPSIAQKHASSVRIGVRFISHKRGRVSSSLRGDMRESNMMREMARFMMMDASFLKENRMVVNEGVLLTLIKRAFSYIVGILNKYIRKGIDALMDFLGLSPSEVTVTGTLS